MNKALIRNPEIQQRIQELRGTELGVSIARSAYLPRINASLSYNRGREEINRVYGQLDKNYQVGVSTSLTYNLFDGFSKRANLNRATASMLAAKEELEQVQRTITLEVQKAFFDMDQARQVTGINRENIASAEEDLRLAEERYWVGAGTLLEVIDAQVSLTRAKVNRVQAEYDLRISEAKLEYAMGE